jgi:hypothetical protein
VPPGLAKLFKSIDADGSGTITVEELKKALQDWGHRIHDVSPAAGHMLTAASSLGLLGNISSIICGRSCGTPWRQ